MTTYRRITRNSQKPPPIVHDANRPEKTEPEKNVKIYHGIDELDDEWQPSFASVIKLLLSMRIASALWNIINDCDEVYNYWEPLHLFLHGEGFQTWEYSPEYGIRSYLYIYLHYWPAYIFTMIFGDAKIAVFTMVRLALGVFCLFGEYYAYLAICRRINIATGRFFVVFTCFSPGMFISSTAFLPSSFSMALNFYTLGAYLNEKWMTCIFCTALSALVGWPFAALLALPIILDMVIVQNRYKEFIWRSLLAGLPILVLLYHVDSYHFGKFVVAPWNIICYNLVSGPGPTLYGEEPLNYFFNNLFINWNVAFPIALLAYPISFMCYKTICVRPSEHVFFGKGTRLSTRFLPMLMVTTTFVLWLTLLSFSKHKEERFMFPAYPLLAMLAAVGVDALNRMCLFKKNFVYLIMGCYVALSASRTYSLYYNYGAHVEIYKTLHDELSSHTDFRLFNNPIRVCVGKEWHRFPSSFFIPNMAIDEKGSEVGIELKFLQSEFRGLLPKPFEKAKNLVDVTRHIPTEMNNMNQEEPSRYVPLETCDYVIDVDMPASEREPDFRTMPDQLKPIVRLPFIDRARSSNLFRVFYAPYFSNKYNVFTHYTLYRKVHN